MPRGVAILFTHGSNMVFDKVSCDTEGRIIIASLQFNNKKFLLINLYNNNDQKGQLQTISCLKSLLNQHHCDGYLPIFAGDFNFIFGENDFKFGNPILKKDSLAAITNITEKLELCDIFRVRFPDKRRFTFCQKNRSYSGDLTIFSLQISFNNM